ncbi:Uncharacterized protein Adt_11158 [Abeliophyllum distichum]|uniref:Uncharacterized protein n=1 Tax=Abeliophyllum distichum TaxID=126358 RepID=A0ABD1UM26_9LAMI
MERSNIIQLQLPVQPPICEIDTIIGGPHSSENLNNSQKRYICEAKEPANVNYHLHTPPVETRRSDLITLFSTDVVEMHFLHNNAMVVRAVVARNGQERMLVDDGSSVNIFYGTMYDKMRIETLLTLATNPIYGFTGDSIIHRRTIVLITEMDEIPTTIRTSIEYLVVDKSSSYHGIPG